MSQQHRRQQLFTLRLWLETTADGQAEWRGQLKHVQSGETRYFRDWAKLAQWLEEMLPASIEV